MQLDDLYFHPGDCPCGCGGLLSKQLSLQLETFPVLELTAGSKRTLATTALQEIYSGNSDEINRNLFDLYNNNYHQAVGAVYGQQSDGLAQLFKINLGRLAAAKTFWVTAELDRARADENGVVRSWNEYKKEANKIIKLYNRYQVAEYNTIIARCRTAEQFERFRERAHISPNLKWIRTTSYSPREIHVVLVGLILPIEHPFWLDNQPGNLYNCKCDWVQTDEPVSEHIPDGIKPNKGLEGNPAITEEIFTDNHPYFDVIRDRFRHVPDMGELMQPDKIAFIKQTTPSGKTFLEHSLVRKEAETPANRIIVGQLLDNGFSNIKLLPQIYSTQRELRERYYGKEYAEANKTKCPDASIGGVLVEFKHTSIRNMSNRLYSASKQSNTVVLKMTESVSKGYLQRFAYSQFEKKKVSNVEKIIIISDDNVYVFDRKAKAK